MININQKYVGLDKRNINTATWDEKIKKQEAKKNKNKKTKYHKDFKQIGQVFPKSELDSDDLKEDDSISISSADHKPCSSQNNSGTVEYYNSETDKEYPSRLMPQVDEPQAELDINSKEPRVKPNYLVRAVLPH